MTRPPPTTGRPTVEATRRSPWRFIREEWGLLALAGALTLMTWYVMRLDVERDHTLTADLDLRVDEPDQIALVRPPATLRIKLRCSESELEEARAILRENDNVVRVLVHANRKFTDVLPLSNLNTTVLYPFRKGYLAGDQPVLAGWIARVQPHTATIATPELRGAGARDVLCTFESDNRVKFPVPPGFVGETIQPDPIELDEIRKKLGDREFVVVNLSFNRWVDREPSIPASTFRAKVRSTLDFAVKLQFVKRATRKVQNRAIYAVQNADLYAFKIKDRTDVGLTLDPPDFVELALTAPEALLKRLENNLGGWNWGIRILGDLPTESGTTKSLTADIVFMAHDPEFLNPAIEFKAPKDSRGFEVEVTPR